MLIVQDARLVNTETIEYGWVVHKEIVFDTIQRNTIVLKFKSDEEAQAAFEAIIEAYKRGEKVFYC